MQRTDRELVLASNSAARCQMLKAAGLSFEVLGANVDEAAIRKALDVESGAMPPGDVAEILARAKAEDVASRSDDDAAVIGGDQVLCLGDEILSKADDMEAARAQLLKLAGKRHQLHSAAVLVLEGDVVWSHVEMTEITMRDYSPTFVGQYLSAAGDNVLGSVGCYQVEGLGAQLIAAIDGDFFNVLGLPLLALFNELRRREVLLS